MTSDTKEHGEPVMSSAPWKVVKGKENTGRGWFVASLGDDHNGIAWYIETDGVHASEAVSEPENDAHAIVAWRNQLALRQRPTPERPPRQGLIEELQQWAAFRKYMGSIDAFAMLLDRAIAALEVQRASERVKLPQGVKRVDEQRLREIMSGYMEFHAPDYFEIRALAYEVRNWRGLAAVSDAAALEAAAKGQT